MNAYDMSMLMIDDIRRHCNAYITLTSAAPGTADSRTKAADANNCSFMMIVELVC